MKVPNKKKMEIEDLAVLVQKGFSDINQRMATKAELKNLATKADLENLAMMTKRGFDEVHEKMDAGFSEVYKKMATKNDLNELEDRMDRKIEGLGTRIATYTCVSRYVIV